MRTNVEYITMRLNFIFTFAGVFFRSPCEHRAVSSGSGLFIFLSIRVTCGTMLFWYGWIIIITDRKILRKYPGSSGSWKTFGSVWRYDEKTWLQFYGLLGRHVPEQLLLWRCIIIGDPFRRIVTFRTFGLFKFSPTAERLLHSLVPFLGSVGAMLLLNSISSESPSSQQTSQKRNA